MKIAIVIERFARGPGGAELDAVRTVQELRKRGHEVSVVCRIASLPPEPGLEIRLLRVPSVWQPLRVTLFSRAAGQATAEGFDIVHSFARTRQQQIYRCGGGSHAEYMERVYRSPRLLRRLSPRHRAILRIEEAVFRDPRQTIHCIARLGAQEIIARYGLPEARVATIYNGVDTERFNPDLRELHRERLRLSLDIDGPLALFIGGGFHRKGLDRALRGLAGAPGTPQLVVIGGGAGKAAALRLARELGLEHRVHFLGHREDVEAWHAAADLLVLPTRYDPFANVVLEAMASALPVATTRAAGAAELIDHGRNGFIFEDDFAPAFALLADLPRLSEIGAAARRTAEQLSWSRHADRLLELYEKTRS